MPIKRNPSPIRANFTIIRNATIEDTSLSWEARGMLVYLLSKPDNWVVNTKHLATQSPTAKRERVLKILAELEAHGYLVQEQGRDSETGSFEQVTRVVFDTPVGISPDETAIGFTGSGITGSGITGSGNPDRIVSTDLEQVLNEARTENISPPIPSGLGDTDSGSAKSASEKKAEREAAKEAEYLALFEQLWAIYPRKVRRSDAFAKLKTLLRAGVPPAELLEATTNYARIRQYEDSAFTLHAATFWGPSQRWRDYLDGGPAMKEKNQTNKPKGFGGIQEFLDRGE